jgi:hypothetical protein
VRRIFSFLSSRVASSARKRREAHLSHVVRLMASSLSTGNGWVIQDSWSYWNCEGWTLQHVQSGEEVSFSHDADQGTWGAHIDWMTLEEKNHMTQALKKYLSMTEADDRTIQAQRRAARADTHLQALPA